MRMRLPDLLRSEHLRNGQARRVAVSEVMRKAH
jgi:hypothetical protein